MFFLITTKFARQKIEPIIWRKGVVYLMFCLFLSHFQDNQRDLENATEKLSEYLERDISAENVVDIKQKVQDMYR